MVNVSVVCFLASYLVAFGLELTRLLRRFSVNRAVLLLAGAAGLTAHTFYLFNRSGQTGMPPLLSSTHDWMLVLAWLAIAFYLFLTAIDRKLPVGLFLLPLVLALIGAAYFVSESPNPFVAPRGADARETILQNWAMLHSSLLVFGIGGVILGLVLSLMYLVQHRRLKHRQTMAGDLALPSLERLARLNWWAVMISIPLLTLGMLVGVGLGWYTRQGGDPVSFTDPVVLVDGLVWLLMVAFLVWLLRTKRPAGKQVAWMTVWAFGFLLVTLIGVQVLTGGLPAMSTWHV